MGKDSTRPSRWRSSGMWATPSSVMVRGVALVTSWPRMRTEPPVAGRSPVSTSTSSVWPLPWTPATPSTSPARTNRSTPRRTGWWRWSPRPSGPVTSSTTSAGDAGPLSTISVTSRPTIISASSSSEVSAGVVSPVTRPLRRTMTRSAMVITSLSLWVIKMIDLPWSTSPRMISNSSSVSWGVSTAVGSSRIRISASR